MTLNITIFSEKFIYQSSDFRLADFKPDSDGRFVPLEDNSPKLIALRYKKWAGYLTYCGVGKWNYKPTYESASEWIGALGPHASFNDVARTLETQGSHWIQCIQGKIGKFQGHTFILGAFDEGLPRIAIVSNVNSTKGPISRSAEAGLRATFGVDRGTHVYVTGLDNAVPRDERMALKRLIASNAEPNVVRHRLARINAAASKRIEAHNGISESCMCYSLDRLGGGYGEIYGQVIGRLVPIHLINGENMMVASGLGNLLGKNAQLRGSSFATSDSSNSEATKHIDCTIQLGGDGSSPTLVGYDLGRMNEQHVAIASANERRSIVGQLRRPVSALPQAFLWIDGQEILELQGLGGSMSNAKDVNNANVVVGSAATASGEWRAVIWRGGGAPINLGTLDANNSAGNAINDREFVVGEIYRSPATPQTEYHRAFLWTASEGMTLIPGTEDRWSIALDINNNGEILGWYRAPDQMRSFVWSQSAGLRIISGGPGTPFYASSINDAGVVVGEVDDNSGVRKAAVWTARDGLQRLNVPFEFHPTAIDAEGNIVGHDSHRPSNGAWLVTARGNVISIPGGNDHSINAHAIVRGAIFGSASKEGWRHQHPIRWDFVAR